MACNSVMRIKRLGIIALAIGSLLSCVSAFAGSINSVVDQPSPNLIYTGPLRDFQNNGNTDAPYGKPFLLEKGNANVNARTTNANALDGVTPGQYYDGTCNNTNTFLSVFPLAINYYTPTNINLPICKGAVATSKRCPKSFVPVVTVSPVSIATTSYTPIFACQTPSHVSMGTYLTGVLTAADGGFNGATGYSFQFITPAASSRDGTAWEPFVSVKWEMWCYPTVVRDNTFGTANVKPPAREPCTIAKSSNLDTQIMLWDRGNIDFIGATNFNTHRKCPINWTPSIEFGAAHSEPGTKPNTFNGEMEMMGPQVACVSGITTVSNHYSVDFITKASHAELEYDKNHVSIDDSQAAAVANLHWSLYCYPPNIPPATIANTAGDMNCTTGTMNTP